MTAFININISSISNSNINSKRRKSTLIMKVGFESDLPVAIIKISFLIKESAPINNIIKIKCTKCDPFNLDIMSATSSLIATKTTVPRCSSMLVMVGARCVKFFQVSVLYAKNFVATAHQ